MERRALIAAVLAAAVMMTADARAQTTPDESLWRAVGASRVAAPTEAPPLALRDLAGQTVELKQLRGQVVLLYFWTTW